MNFNRSPDIAPVPRQLPDEFKSSDKTVDLLEASPPSPEAYDGCVVEVMQMANRGNRGALEAVGSTVIGSRGTDFAAACGRCGITLVRSRGVVYGAKKCPEVVSGNIGLGELA